LDKPIKDTNGFLGIVGSLPSNYLNGYDVLTKDQNSKIIIAGYPIGDKNKGKCC
jgi:hypothetical protein